MTKDFRWFFLRVAAAALASNSEVDSCWPFDLGYIAVSAIARRIRISDSHEFSNLLEDNLF